MNKLLAVLAVLALGGCGGGIMGGIMGGGGTGTPISGDLGESTVTSGTVLPFGEVAINCEVVGGDIGVKVDANGSYTLYDSNPNETGQRTHYIIGFKDNCARQFTAATSLMGDIGTHEVVRYLPSNSNVPYSVTDNAYETIKSAFCGTGRGRACGAKLNRLAKITSFVTVYEQFGENPTWSNILLHDGQVIAIGPAEG